MGVAHNRGMHGGRMGITTEACTIGVEVKLTL